MTSLPAPTTIVLGPPGTGKTTDLLGRVDQLLQSGVEPPRIGYYAFTRRAAYEARDRACAKFGMQPADFPHFRTLHSECMRQMGHSSGQVLDGERMADFADWIGERITGRFTLEDGMPTGYEPGDRMLFMDGLARVRGVGLRRQYDEDHDNLDWVRVERFSRGLREYKQARALVDFTDMLELFAHRGPAGLGLTDVFVDESQDLSALQWQVTCRLAHGALHATVGGDDDQAIYRWAGANPTHLQELEGETTVLGQSYRVPRAVQRVAGEIIGRVRARRGKRWAPRPVEGRVSYASSLEEVDWTGPGVLVLARNQYLLEPILRELRSSGVLYEYHGRPSVRQSVLDAVVTWERLRGGEQQSGDQVRRMYQHLELQSGVRRGHKTLPGVDPEQLLTMAVLRDSHGLCAPPVIWHQALTAIPADERQYMIRCRRQGERFSQAPRVRVGTIHDSKGGERDRVVLLTDMAPRTHAEMRDDPDSEHRVFYVGATRAREELVVVRPRTSLSYEV